MTKTTPGTTSKTMPMPDKGTNTLYFAMRILEELEELKTRPSMRKDMTKCYYLFKTIQDLGRKACEVSWSLMTPEQKECIEEDLEDDALRRCLRGSLIKVFLEK